MPVLPVGAGAGKGGVGALVAARDECWQLHRSTALPPLQTLFLFLDRIVKDVLTGLFQVLIIANDMVVIATLHVSIRLVLLSSCRGILVITSNHRIPGSAGKHKRGFFGKQETWEKSVVA